MREFKIWPIKAFSCCLFICFFNSLASAQLCSGSWSLQRPLTDFCVTGQWVGWQNTNNPVGCPVTPLYGGTQSNTFTFANAVSNFTIDFSGFDGPVSCARIEIKINGTFYPLTSSNVSDFPPGSTCMSGSFTSIVVTSDGYITKSDLNPSGLSGQGRININNVTATNVTVSTNDSYGTAFSNPFNCVDIVPLQLIRFEGANTNNCTAKLDWVTGIELNVKKIEIQQSFDGALFQTIESILPKGSNSTYSFEALNNSDDFYRLRIIDIDGSYKFSKIIQVKSNCKRKTLFVSPNPTSDFVEVSEIIKDDQIFVFDMLGRKILAFQPQINDRRFNIQSLQSGVYILKVFNKGYTRAQFKIIKVH